MHLRLNHDTYSARKNHLQCRNRRQGCPNSTKHTQPPQLQVKQTMHKQGMTSVSELKWQAIIEQSRAEV